MRDHLGRMSVIGAVLSWSTLVIALVSGGIDPAPVHVQRLRASMLSALCIAAIALAAAVVAVVRGPQRISATMGLVLALAFIVVFTGFGLPALGFGR
jgi:hypothetical protein